MTKNPSDSNQRVGCVLAVVLAIGMILGLALGIAAMLWPGSPLHSIGGQPASTVAAPSSNPSAPKQLWTCGMHPQIIQDHPGLCPICHMELTPLKSAAGAGDSNMTGFAIDPSVVQNMGVRTAQAVRQPLNRSIRAFGYLEEAQPNIHDVNLRVSGWVTKLHADTLGMHVNQGDPLFDLYSPELQLAMEELIAARRVLGAMQVDNDDLARRSTQSLVDAASRKLEVLGLQREHIEQLAGLDRAPDTLTFRSASTGIVTEKNIVEGSEVKSGDTALRIVDYSMLWLEVRVFEADLRRVQLGQRVAISLPVHSDVDQMGRVIFISPSVDDLTRTATVRVRLNNDGLNLKPGMYASARIESHVDDDALVIPREAVIDTGEKRVAFIMPAPGHFEPRDLRLGEAGDGGLVQVLDGLNVGDTVVVSGQFLLDSESHIREAVQKFLRPDAQPATKSSAGPANTHSEKRARTIPLHGEWQAKLDTAVSAYLDLAKILGAPQIGETAVDSAGFIAATHAINAAWSGMPTEALAARLASEADGLSDKPLDQLREQFKVVSAALIELVGTHPPSAAVADQLFVIHCPMAPGDWLQTSNEVANPYYATEMKECGAVVWTIVPVAADSATTQKDGHE